MISDTLSDARHQIREYLEQMPEVYPADSEIVREIRLLLVRMGEIQMRLDAGPESTEQDTITLMEHPDGILCATRGKFAKDWAFNACGGQMADPIFNREAIGLVLSQAEAHGFRVIDMRADA